MCVYKLYTLMYSTRILHMSNTIINHCALCARSVWRQYDMGLYDCNGNDMIRFVHLIKVLLTNAPPECIEKAAQLFF